MDFEDLPLYIQKFVHDLKYMSHSNECEIVQQMEDAKDTQDFLISASGSMQSQIDEATQLKEELDAWKE